MSKAIHDWHELLNARNAEGLNALIAEDATFHSPVVHTPQQGKALVVMYLTAAFHAIFDDSFKYVREIIGEDEAALEFECKIGDIHVNGIDLIKWNEADQIVDFKVLVRPLKGVNAIHQRMGEILESLSQNKN